MVPLFWVSLFGECNRYCWKEDEMTVAGWEATSENSIGFDSASSTKSMEGGGDGATSLKDLSFIFLHLLSAIYIHYMKTFLLLMRNMITISSCIKYLLS